MTTSWEEGKPFPGSPSCGLGLYDNHVLPIPSLASFPPFRSMVVQKAFSAAGFPKAMNGGLSPSAWVEGEGKATECHWGCVSPWRPCSVDRGALRNRWHHSGSSLVIAWLVCGSGKQPRLLSHCPNSISHSEPVAESAPAHHHDTKPSVHPSSTGTCQHLHMPGCSAMLLFVFVCKAPSSHS